MLDSGKCEAEGFYSTLSANVCANLNMELLQSSIIHISDVLL